jgi:hypothetical protein
VFFEKKGRVKNLLIVIAALVRQGGGDGGGRSLILQMRPWLGLGEVLVDKCGYE